jgi:hypothetical protein
VRQRVKDEAAEERRMPSSEDQSCSLLTTSEQHAEQEMPLPCDIINGRRFCRGKDDFFSVRLF